MAGLQAIITNNSTLFNIDASAYSLWKGNTSPSTGTVSFAKIQAAIAKAVNKGLMEKATVLVGPAQWGNLNADQAALRVFDKSYASSKAENGVESLEFHSTNGPIEIVSHPLVKYGDAFVIPTDSVQRIGSVDLTFQVPGFDTEFFRLVSGTNAVEVQCMADQAIFIERPAHSVYLSGLT
jgi:hypothetical protein